MSLFHRLEERAPMMRAFVGYFDGCCEPINPGGTMGFGAAVLEDDKLIWQASGISGPDQGPTSNNLAEYTGLLALLWYLHEGGFVDNDIEIRGDSELVIEQMAGRWQIGKGLYVPPARQAQKLAAEFSRMRFQWVPRDQNQLADELSKAELIRAGVPISTRRSA